MTSKLYFCTYFDHRYLARALCLYDSLCEQSPSFTLHVLALSDECESILRNLNLCHIEILPLKTLEALVPQLLVAKENRSLVEYYFTLTSVFTHFLCTRLPSQTLLTYLDSDLYFFASPLPIIEELQDASVGIIEHRFSTPNQDKLKYGRFNVGWVSFRNDPCGVDCLEDWSTKCLEWCYDRLEPTRFADQKYLDSWPTTFSGVHIIEHPGANVGPWNIEDFCTEGTNTVNGSQLIFAHFQYVRKVGARTYSIGFDDYQVDPRKRKQIVGQIYKPYLRHLLIREHSIDCTLPKKATKKNALRHQPTNDWLARVHEIVIFPLKQFSMKRRYNWVSV